MSDMSDSIRGIILRLLELDDSELTETSLFREEHDADSMMLIEIQAALEAEFDIVVENTELPHMTNLAAVRDVVARAARRSSATEPA